MYLKPNETMMDFRRTLDALDDAVLGTDGRMQIGGDFNARAGKEAFPW